MFKEKKETSSFRTVAVIGLGYVGLPLMWTFQKEGFGVIGFDIDTDNIDLINNGVSYIKHFDTPQMQILKESKRCKVTNDFSLLNEDCDRHRSHGCKL